MSLFADFHFNAHALAPFVTANIVLLFGGIILAQDWRSQHGRYFFRFSMTVAGWLLSVAFMYCAGSQALTFARIEYTWVPLIPACAMDFGLAATNRLDQYRRLSLGYRLVSLGFIAAAWGSDRFLVGIREYWWGPYPLYGEIGSLFLLFFAVLLLANLRLYYLTARHDRDPRVRKRARMFLISFSVIYLGSVDFLPKYGVPVYPFGFVPVLIFSVLTSVSIHRYRLISVTPALAAPNIIDTMNDPLFVLDRDGRILFTNNAACTVLHTGEQQVVQHLFADFFPVSTAAIWSEVQKRGESIYRFETEGCCPQLKDRWFEISASAVRDPEGDTLAAVCVARDVTARTRAQQRLLKIRNQLTAEVRNYKTRLAAAHNRLLHTEKMCALGKLSASIAHEFGNPVFAIRNLLEGLKDAVDPDQQELLALGIQECNRLRNMLQNMQDFYVPGSGRRESISLHRLIDEVLLLYRRQFVSRGICLQLRLEAIQYRIYGCREQLKQVILNLLSNAEEAIGDRGGEIVIKTESGEGFIKLSISDSGSGIEPEILPRIFEPFVTSKNEKFGTGLGLSITYGIVKSHGGSIDVDSQPGKGAVFTVTFSLSREADGFSCQAAS